MTWWRFDSQRFALEVDLLRRASNGSFGRIGEVLVFDEELLVDGLRFGIRILFPDNFPFAPPRAFLLRPELPASLDIHRFVDGGLCLHASDEWTPRCTGLWLRNRAAAWVHAVAEFSNTGEWPAI